MSKRIGATVASVLAAGAVALTGSATAASSPAREIAKLECPQLCPTIYQPVTCELSDGSTMTFSNRCYATSYACNHGLTIVSCRSGV